MAPKFGMFVGEDFEKSFLRYTHYLNFIKDHINFYYANSSLSITTVKSWQYF